MITKKTLLSILSASALAASIGGSALADGVSPDGHSGSPPSMFDTDGLRTVCLNSTSNLGIDWRHTLTVDVNAAARTADVVSGFISGTICDAPNWSHTGGRFTLNSMSLQAVHVGGGSCLSSLDMQGQRNPPPRYKWSGQYCFDGTSCFPHVSAVLFPRPC